MNKTLLLLTTLLLTFSINAQQAYYNDVDLTKSGLDLKEELATKTISEHSKTLSYSQVWDALKVTDLNPENSSEVLLIYGYSDTTVGTTARRRGKDQNGGNQGDWNREHTYAKSLGDPNLGTSGPGADAHHLRPSDVSFNGQRGHLKFVDGNGNAGSVSGGWYPGDEWKGDVARMMMYMYIRYGDRCKPTGVGIGSSSSTPDDMIDLFLEWNAEDPVSNFERQRNTYHDSNASYAQGNRNPFIDNAYLATKIWGGPAALDSWESTPADEEAPTAPTNVVLSNITYTTIDVAWTASTDNVAVSAYEIFVNGVFNGETSNTTYNITDLIPSTSYTITVLAKDNAENESAQSAAVNTATLTDNTPPSVPTNITISNQTGTSFKVNWSASTDDISVGGYDIFVDSNLIGTTTELSFVVTGLTVSTTYSVTLLAKDTANNQSVQSNAVSATTTDGSNHIFELFFSEYIEGSSSNKAIEIANFTGQTVSLADYSVKLASNGNSFGTTLTFTTESIEHGEVYIIGNADMNICEDEVDVESSVTYFNGNDVIGLFKNDVLIDIIGEEGDDNDFAENVTLKRKPTIISPNTVFNAEEWIETSTDDCSDLGSHNVSTAGLNTTDFATFKMYPNPTNGNKIYFNITKDVAITIYNVLGKIVKTEKISTTNNSIDISKLSQGIYLVKIKSQNQFITTKLIKK
ncbi:endonuclease [Polaribacter sp. MSW13]|uniref:Endonuclease n=1 Tax=Polaribacter marinus TaxID=2916838 RepID=A0A9X1VL79_9FLAO|nr:endonuclease [Polaribacter marinus]MCI2228095.1 endonuclease [Polaribacter marinus]